jgi:hypothetical protein
MRNALVVAQVALSLVLLVGSSLFLRSLHNAWSIDLGMRTDHLLMMGFDPKLHHYTPDKTRQFLTQLRERVTALPGVKSVSYVDSVPLSMGSHTENVQAEGGKRGTEPSHADVFNVGTDFFETMGIPLLRGQAFHSPHGTARS